MGKRATMVELMKKKKHLKDKVIDDSMNWRGFCDYCKDEYDIGKDYATDLWKAIWKDIDKQIEKHDLIKATQLINNLNDLASDNNKWVRLKAIQELNKLGGFYSTEKSEITHKGDITLNWGE